MSTEVIPPVQAMSQMIAGSVFLSRSLYVAAELGVADQMAEGPQTCTALAAACGAHAPSLARLLRALASVGVFAEDEQGRVGLTPLAESLRSDTTGSLRALAQFYGAPWHMQVWNSLLHGVQTGETPIAHASGMSVFEYFMRHQEHFALFDEAMTSFSVAEAEAVVAGYDFSGITRLVDVGGGHGYLLASILRAYPALRGLLLDLPPVVPGAQRLLSRLGLAERCDTLAGDFFERVPPGGDAYMLKNIIHDFDDERAGAILRSCRRAMSPGARLLIIQEVLPPGNAPSPGKLLDMQMLLIGGRERTEDEYRDLLRSCAFRLQRVVPLPAPLHVIEAVPAE
jgi:hypothetical protein